MSEDYLWDRSGTPDPEIQKLEQVLGELRHRGPAPAWPEVTRRSWARTLPIPAAAAIAASIAAGILLFFLWPSLRAPEASWQVVRLSGAPLVAGSRLQDEGRIAEGDRLETDANSAALLRVGTIGTVRIEPSTNLRLLVARATEHRLSLERGRLTARIDAPPRVFVVDTPSAVATDLGCEYTLEVDDSGAGILRVASGWVEFSWRGRDSLVPAGAECVTQPGVGPGTPYFSDASRAFREALARFDFEGAGAESLRVILSEARERDALTVWHLLSRVPDQERGPVYDRLDGLVSAPASVTRDGVLRLDPDMLERWRIKIELLQ